LGPALAKVDDATGRPEGSELGPALAKVVSLETTPSGVTVTGPEGKLGVTPIYVEVPVSGVLVVTLDKTGYKPQTVRLDGASPARVEATMRPAMWIPKP